MQQAQNNKSSLLNSDVVISFVDGLMIIGEPYAKLPVQTTQQPAQRQAA